jgi:hypothetical protein
LSTNKFYELGNCFGMNAEHAFYSATFLGLLPKLLGHWFSVKVILMDEKSPGLCAITLHGDRASNEKRPNSLYTGALAET